MSFWAYILFGTVYLIITYAGKTFDGETLLLIKSLYLTVYLLIEILILRYQDHKNWMISPVVLASVITFILGYGITNLIYFVPNSETRDKIIFRLGDSSFTLVNTAMDAVFIGAVFMWIGYRSNLGIFLFRFMTTTFFNVKKYFRTSFNYNKKLIFSLIIISASVRIYAMTLGVYGYANTPEQIAKAADISQYLNYLGLASRFALLVVSFAYFSSPKQSRTDFYILVTLVAVEVFFGLMSGMKTLVIIPFVIPFLTYFILKRHIKKSLLIFAVASVILAYIIIEPFRMLSIIDPNFKSSPKYILQTLYNAYILNKQIGIIEETDTEFFLFAVLGRANYLVEAAMAMDYKDRVGLSENDPDFANRLFFAPLHAVTPRFLWKDKPMENVGLWFTRQVWGLNFYTSTAVTPFGFLYLAGGYTLIIIFFFIFGIMQNTLLRFIDFKAGGIVIFLALLPSLVLIDHVVNSIFISWIRFYPAIILLQYIVLKDDNSINVID